MGSAGVALEASPASSVTITVTTTALFDVDIAPSWVPYGDTAQAL
jgi:hypothetical protein